MTVMGMAASQARFLGLTARKSNVEYQVQQINQQRTSLANESAGLYNQMMELSVPTPPNTNSFYTTNYVLDNSGDGYGTEDYKIVNMKKTYNSTGEYVVTLSKTQESHVAEETNFTFQNYGKVDNNPDNDEKSAAVTIRTANGVNLTLTCLKQAVKDENKNITGWEVPVYGADNDKSVLQNQIYALDPQGPFPDGYDVCKDGLKGDYTYFFRDKNGKNVFLTKEDYEKLFPQDEQGNFKEGEDRPVLDENQSALTFASTHIKRNQTTEEVTAYLEEAENGRLTGIAITEDENNELALRGKEYSLSAVQEYDEKAYDQAYSDYEYEKALYEKAVSDINAKTESIQAKDQSLELKIQQLDTEQNAVNTEMQSVQKIVEDNVEKTFNVFG